jgi:hypothetical protein
LREHDRALRHTAEFSVKYAYVFGVNYFFRSATTILPYDLA